MPCTYTDANATRNINAGAPRRRVLKPLRVVQPQHARQSTADSEHATAAGPSPKIERLSGEMARTGAPSDAVELLVVDGAEPRDGAPVCGLL
jgi:hypothetical protein